MAASLVIFASGGTLLTYWYDKSANIQVRLFGGLCFSAAFASMFAFATASIFGLNIYTILISIAVAGLPLLLLIRRDVRAMLRADMALLVRGLPQSRRVIVVNCLTYSLLLGLLVGLFNSAMIEKSDGIYTAALNNIGDLPFHLHVISSFAWGDNIPPEHPLFAGARFAYPFLSDFLSAVFVVSGTDLRTAMLAPNVVFAFAMCVLLKSWTEDVTCDALAAWIAVLLVIFSGGLGWYEFLIDATSQLEGNASGSLLKASKDYTIRGESVWRWGNTLTTLFVPQRSFTLGAALAIYTWHLWWVSGAVPGDEGDVSSGSTQWRSMFVAGFISGLLPLVHAHTFLVMMLAAAFFAFGTGLNRGWLIYAAVVTVLAGPQLLWISMAGTVRAGSFLAWSVGWDHGQTNPLWFWILNTGAVIPIIVCVLAFHFTRRPVVSSQVVAFYIPFAVCFFLANMVKLAPWIWDNIKVLFYWYLASVPLIARFLSTLFRRGFPLRALAVMLFLSLTFAGSIDVWRLVTRASVYREFDSDAINIATFLRNHSRPDSVVLHAPSYNSPVSLSGRQSLLGYTGIVWSHGLQYRNREQDIQSIYEGKPGASDLLKRYNVEFVVVGPQERKYVTVNESFLSKYTKVVERGAYRVYSTTGAL